MISMNDNLSWDRVYLLWFEHPSYGRQLTTWSDGGNTKYIEVVVQDCEWLGPPLWDAYEHNAKLIWIPTDKDPSVFIRDPYRDFVAGGWFLNKPFQRHTKLTWDYIKSFKNKLFPMYRIKDEDKRDSLWVQMSDAERTKVVSDLELDKHELPSYVAEWVKSNA